MVANPSWATIKDLDAIPEDGNRYELLNRAIWMADAPTYQHQMTVRTLFRLIDRWTDRHGLGDTLFVPVDIVLDDQNSLQPDILSINEQYLTMVRGA